MHLWVSCSLGWRAASAGDAAYAHAAVKVPLGSPSGMTRRSR